MAFDPLTFWLQGSMFWATVMRQQQHAYLQMLCNMANAAPRESAAEIAAEAEKMRRTASKPTPLHRRPRAGKPSARSAKAPAAKSVPA